MKSATFAGATLLNPTVNGVPTAPYAADVESATKAKVTPAIGVNPKAIVRVL